jgi:hypothetical protein
MELFIGVVFILTGMQTFNDGRGVDEVSAANGTNEVRIEFLQFESLQLLVLLLLLLHLQHAKQTNLSAFCQMKKP